uniref:RING-CH-type domain-containing protein n=1 Tax=Aegilops tauschii subsp. strangulata TaxID=200361 RepID=A0A453RTW0_AEGTS
MDRSEEETIMSDSDPLLDRNDQSGSLPQLSPPQPATVTVLEIEDEETDGSYAACCRICLEAESEIGDELISPCMCKGTQQFVHRSCLDHWRSVKVLSLLVLRFPYDFRMELVPIYLTIY